MTNEELVESYQNGNKKALEELIEQNTGIVYKLANKYKYVNRRNDLDNIEIPEDIIQEGYLGMILAANNYDFNNPKKAKFITYAIYWINQKMYNYTVGHSEKEKANNKIYGKCTSLNTPIGLEDDGELQDTIEGIDYNFENIEEQIYLKQLRNDLESAMGKYNTLREREVLKFRFGWDMKPMSMNEVGDIYGITGERVRQLQSRALRRLRNSIWVRANRDRFIQDGFMDDPFKGLYKYNW